MKKYQDIVFLQESEADEAMTIEHNNGLQALCNYLKQWDNGDNDGNISIESPAGTTDFIYEIDGYLLSINYGVPYVGLSKIIEQ